MEPDPTKVTKRKTRVLKRNSHPSFMEMVIVNFYIIYYIYGLVPSGKVSGKISCEANDPASGIF